LRRVDGQNIDDPQQLREAVQKVGPGKEIGLKDTKEVKARLEEAPGDVFQPFGRRREPAPIVPEMRAPRNCAGSNSRWSACKNAFRNSNASSTSSLAH
jgi:hypothetical protein